MDRVEHLKHLPSQAAHKTVKGQEMTDCAMTILYVDNTSTFGGAINSLSHLLRGLDRKRFVPVVVSGQSAEQFSRHFPGCTCYHLVPKLSWVDNQRYRSIRSLPVFRIRVVRQLMNLARYLYWLLFIYTPEGFRLYRIGKRHRVTLVHLNNILGSQLPGIIAARLLGVPCVAHLRDFEEVHPLTRLYARLIDHHLAISGPVRDNLLQLGVPSARITLTHDGIDLNEFRSGLDCRHLGDEFGLPAATPRFGIFGRVVSWKGVREFLFCAKYAVERCPGVKAFIVGDASETGAGYLEEMKRLAVNLGLENDVIFTGYRTDVAALMKFMDVIVHASIRPEPFGMVLIEAMALEKPVVATRAGGPLEIVIDGETGLLVDMGDADAMGRAVLALLQQPQQARKMGQAGKKRVDLLFSNTRYARQVEGVYQQVSRGQG